MLAMIIYVAQVGIDNDTLGSQLAMKLGVLRGIERHEIIWHDTTTTINRAMLA